jgi:hypothetical protein
MITNYANYSSFALMEPPVMRLQEHGEAVRGGQLAFYGIRHTGAGNFSVSHIAKAISLFAFVLILNHVNASAQTYNARTDVAVQAYPATIPCPSASGCSAGGALTGSGYCFTPSDFSTQICRATDNNSPGSQHDYGAGCSGSAEINLMDVSDTRFTVCSGGSVPIVAAFNGSANPPTITWLYGNQGDAGMLGGCSSNAEFILTTPFFSFAQARVGYAESFLSNGDPAICAWNFSSTTTMPTYANGGVTKVVDLASCVPAMAGVGFGTYTDDVSVSADDQTFAALGSTTGGQGSTGAVYVIVWTNGCRAWNALTGVVTGGWGPTGSINLTDRFYLHNVRLNKAGNTVKVTTNTCGPTAGGCTGNTNTYIWQISSLTVNRIINDSTNGCGHSVIGYLDTMNDCGSQYFALRPFSSNDQVGSSILSTYPSAFHYEDGHFSWSSGNSTDTSPVFAALYTGTFEATDAWDNEVLGLRTDGSGLAYRFFHNYITGLDTGNFGAEYGIGSVSQDGKYFLWGTDWDGMLGKIGGGSSSCTIGTNCRADVFLAVLPIHSTAPIDPAPPTGPPAAPTSLRVVID